MANYDLEWLERNAGDGLFSSGPVAEMGLLDTNAKLRMLRDLKQLEQAISTNDLEWLKRLDVKTKLRTIDQYCWNLRDEPWWHMFYGAIGLALFYKADISVFELLLAQGAPTDRVYCREFCWFSAKKAAVELKLDNKIVNLL